jgi:hypothetical protein
MGRNVHLLIAKGRLTDEEEATIPIESINVVLMLLTLTSCIFLHNVRFSVARQLEDLSL